MKVAIGLKAHSGWAALVVIAMQDRAFTVVDRRRIELVDDAWAKQPYHAAEELDAPAARALVQRGIEAARRIATREVRAAVRRERDRKNEVAACVVLTGNPMPAWSVAEILAVHIRMHKAEGVLFRDALTRGVKACRVPLFEIPEALLMKEAQKAMRRSAAALTVSLAALGKSVGPPWGRDQKDAALAAMIALC